MPDRGSKHEIEKEDIRSASPEEFIAAWERPDVLLPVSTEVSPVSAECRVVVHSDPKSAGADRFRLAQFRLRNIQAASRNLETARKLKSLLITSPLPEEGKTTVALNLATLLSEQGWSPVLLLEADVYRPALVKRLGLKPWPGLAECCRSGSDPMLAIRRIDPLGFYLLPAGQPEEGGSSVLQSSFTAQLIKSLAACSFSWILIDSPPTTPVADILALKALADATLLVARAGKTPREAIEESIGDLGRDHILGIMLNGVEGLDRVYSKYYGYGKAQARVKPAKPKTIEGLGLNKHAG